MASSDSLLSTIPVHVWSVLSQVLVGLLLLWIQGSLKRRGSPNFELLNEFLCCCVWLWWSLETTLITVMSSWSAGSLSLFVRLLAYPYISQGGTNNLCTALYLYYTGDRRIRGNWRRLCASLVIGLTAIPITLLLCHCYWAVLGLAVSTHHNRFMGMELDYFLTTSPIYGAICELVPSFLTLLPSIIGNKSFLFNVLNSCVVMVLVFLFSDYTGAFMNPMVALACSLYWYRLSTWDYLVHCAVFWLSPLMATWAAARVELRYKGYQDRHKLI